MGITVCREEAVAIGQRLVEYGLIDHVNSVFRHVHLPFARLSTTLMLSTFAYVTFWTNLRPQLHNQATIAERQPQEARSYCL